MINRAHRLLLTMLVGFTHTGYANKQEIQRNDKSQNHNTIQNNYSINDTIDAVVNISTHAANSPLNGIAGADPRDFPPNFNRPPQSQLGSGIIVDAKHGLIATNSHVIMGSSTVIITMNDGRQAIANVIGADPAFDIAVLHIDLNDLKEIPWADSNKIQVGDRAIAIGNPFGLDASVTSGIISGLHRTPGIEAIEDFVQTDAPINPGNSGGALVDDKGHLTAMNTAILSGGSPNAPHGNIGIGFAIPSHLVYMVVQQIMQFRGTEHSTLGVNVQPVNHGLAKGFKLPISEGVLIAEVAKGTSATHSLHEGDVVLSINGIKVSTPAQFAAIIKATRPGFGVSLDILAYNNRNKIQKRNIKMIKPMPTSMHGNPLVKGMLLEDFKQNTNDGVLHHGIKIVGLDRNSPAWLSGLREGNIITKINNSPVNTLEDWQVATRSIGNSNIILKIQDHGVSAFRVIEKRDGNQQQPPFK